MAENDTVEKKTTRILTLVGIIISIFAGCIGLIGGIFIFHPTQVARLIYISLGSISLLNGIAQSFLYIKSSRKKAGGNIFQENPGRIGHVYTVTIASAFMTLGVMLILFKEPFLGGFLILISALSLVLIAILYFTRSKS